MNDIKNNDSKEKKTDDSEKTITGRVLNMGNVRSMEPNKRNRFFASSTLIYISMLASIYLTFVGAFSLEFTLPRLCLAGSIVLWALLLWQLAEWNYLNFKYKLFRWRMYTAVCSIAVAIATFLPCFLTSFGGAWSINDGAETVELASKLPNIYLFCVFLIALPLMYLWATGAKEFWNREGRKKDKEYYAAKKAKAENNAEEPPTE